MSRLPRKTVNTNWFVLDVAEIIIQKLVPCNPSGGGFKSQSGVRALPVVRKSFPKVDLPYNLCVNIGLFRQDI
ncbi:hypothetical protein TNCT_650621, partial [Trichonephila clavata]